MKGGHTSYYDCALLLLSFLMLSDFECELSGDPNEDQHLEVGVLNRNRNWHRRLNLHIAALIDEITRSPVYELEKHTFNTTNNCATYSVIYSVFTREVLDPLLTKTTAFSTLDSDPPRSCLHNFACQSSIKLNSLHKFVSDSLSLNFAQFD